MRILIEIVTDTREEGLSLLREIRQKIRTGREENRHTVNHCIGDYRITVDEGEDDNRIMSLLIQENRDLKRGIRSVLHGNEDDGMEEPAARLDASLDMLRALVGSQDL